MRFLFVAVGLLLMSCGTMEKIELVTDPPSNQDDYEDIFSDMSEEEKEILCSVGQLVCRDYFPGTVQYTVEGPEGVVVTITHSNKAQGTGVEYVENVTLPYTHTKHDVPAGATLYIRVVVVEAEQEGQVVSKINYTNTVIAASEISSVPGNSVYIIGIAPFLM